MDNTLKNQRYDEMQLSIDVLEPNIQGEREAALHAAFQNTGMYVQLASFYQSQIGSLPSGHKVINFVGRWVGYQTKESKNLAILRSICQEAQQGRFHEHYRAVLDHGIELIVQKANQQLDAAKNHLEIIRQRKRMYESDSKKPDERYDAKIRFHEFIEAEFNGYCNRLQADINLVKK